MVGTRRRRSRGAAPPWEWTVNEIPSTPGCPAAVRSDLSGQDWRGGHEGTLFFLLARPLARPLAGRGPAVPPFRRTELVGDLIRSVRRRQELPILRQRALVVQLPDNRNRGISELRHCHNFRSFRSLICRLCCSCACSCQSLPN